jgi:methylmalonyl-CoA mutase C-terminal domain/subunit
LRDTNGTVLFGGGVIPERDIPGLKAKGVREIFTAGASMKDIIAFIERVMSWRADR